MSKNYTGKLVYLSHEGADALFANPAVANLAVIPLEPNEDYGDVVYEKVYAAGDGEYIGSAGDYAFTDAAPSQEQAAAALEAYLSHVKNLEETYGRFRPQPPLDYGQILAAVARSAGVAVEINPR